MRPLSHLLDRRTFPWRDRTGRTWTRLGCSRRGSTPPGGRPSSSPRTGRTCDRRSLETKRENERVGKKSANQRLAEDDNSAESDRKNDEKECSKGLQEKVQRNIFKKKFLNGRKKSHKTLCCFSVFSFYTYFFFRLISAFFLTWLALALPVVDVACGVGRPNRVAVTGVAPLAAGNLPVVGDTPKENN